MSLYSGSHEVCQELYDIAVMAGRSSSDFRLRFVPNVSDGLLLASIVFHMFSLSRLISFGLVRGANSDAISFINASGCSEALFWQA